MARAHIPFVEPKPLGVSRETIEEIARVVVKDTEFESGGFIKSLVVQLGGTVALASGRHHEIDLEVWGMGDFRIYESDMTSLRRSRFSTAVALSHYLLHFTKIQADLPGYGMQVYRAGFKEPSPEVHRATIEAHWCAAEMLMPTREFLHFMDAEPERLAQRFNVPQSILDIRAKSLRARQAKSDPEAGSSPSANIP
jgi:hypothetical protein